MDHRTRCKYTTTSENLYKLVLYKHFFYTEKKHDSFKKGQIRLHQNQEHLPSYYTAKRMKTSFLTRKKSL